MDSTTFRILDTLSRDPGGGLSINGLVRKIRELGYSAYYKNIYDRVQRLEQEGPISIRKTGNVSLVSLNLDSPRLTDQLVIMELEKKKRIIQEYSEEFIHALESMRGPFSIALIRPSRNIKLNTAEILYLTDDESLLIKSRKLSNRYNKTIYPLMLRKRNSRRCWSQKKKTISKKS